jgi:hypothetical protein
MAPTGMPDDHLALGCEWRQTVAAVDRTRSSGAASVRCHRFVSELSAARSTYPPLRAPRHAIWSVVFFRLRPSFSPRCSISFCGLRPSFSLVGCRRGGGAGEGARQKRPRARSSWQSESVFALCSAATPLHRRHVHIFPIGTRCSPSSHGAARVHARDNVIYRLRATPMNRDSTACGCRGRARLWLALARGACSHTSSTCIAA